MRKRIILKKSDLINIVHRIINETNVNPKKLIGMGAFHSIYPSHKNPDIVYKVGYDLETMNSWVDLFNEHSELFPKTYGNIKEFKIPPGKFGNKINKEITGYFISVEKLDTKKFLNFWNEVDKLSADISSFQDYLYNFDMDKIYLLGQKIKKFKPDLFVDYVNFIDLVDNLYEIKPIADLHKGQFGYDNDGNIKCLDI